MNDPRLSAYADRMKEIVRRSNVIDAFLSRKITALYLPTTVESIYLQFRSILELIATASLIVNDSAVLKLSERGRRNWAAGDILKAVQEINPDFYYPKPIRADDSAIPGIKYDHREFKGDYLTREKFDTLYDVCSKTIHVHNPFDQNVPGKDYERLLKDAIKWRRRIRELLIHHEFRLIGDDNMYITLVRDEQHGDPVVWTFAPVDSNHSDVGNPKNLTLGLDPYRGDEEGHAARTG